jgi:hypothetical protein
MVEQACKCVQSAFELKEQQQRGYERRLSAMRLELEAQGGNLRRMDHVELSQAKSLGLVSAKAVDAEFARRRRPGELSRNVLIGGSTPPIRQRPWSGVVTLRSSHLRPPGGGRQRLLPRT